MTHVPQRLTDRKRALLRTLRSGEVRRKGVLAGVVIFGHSMSSSQQILQEGSDALTVLG